MTKKQIVERIREVFDDVYKDAKCSLDFETPHQLLVAVQLSAQCTDARVNLVTPALFEKYRSVQDFANAALFADCWFCLRSRSVIGGNTGFIF